MSVTVEIHSSGLPERFEQAVPIAVHSAGQLALAGCNYFCKQDMDSLIKSSNTHSHMSGNSFVMRWVTPYAGFQYDYPGTRTERNPNARPHWCQAGYSAYGDNWQREFVNTLHREGL